MDTELRTAIIRALRDLWPARGDQYPDSAGVLAKMLEQGAAQPPLGAMLKTLEAMQAGGEIRLGGYSLSAEAAAEHGAVLITWVSPALLR